MAVSHDTAGPHRPGCGFLGCMGLGIAAGAAVAAGMLLGRRGLTMARVGRGHPLKHRLLDAAAGAMQQKYPRTR